MTKLTHFALPKSLSKRAESLPVRQGKQNNGCFSSKVNYLIKGVGLRKDRKQWGD